MSAPRPLPDSRAQMGMKILEPFVSLERAELARLTGDDATRERELREAHRLFTEIGAPIRAAEVAKELCASCGAEKILMSRSTFEDERKQVTGAFRRSERLDGIPAECPQPLPTRSPPRAKVRSGGNTSSPIRFECSSGIFTRGAASALSSTGSRAGR
jgi:hypothetical protein